MKKVKTLFLKSFYRNLISSSKVEYDVLVVGGGHAGIEAINAANNMNSKVALITQKLNKIGEMSCNPSFGGVGKGHLLREIDALNGICPRICDMAGTHYKTLNISKGYAVRGIYGLMDRTLYKKYLQEFIFKLPIDFYEDTVANLIIEKNKTGELFCKGVILENGIKLYSKSTIITTGTFLNGVILIGHEQTPAGRMGDKASIELSKCFKKLGFDVKRLKTGTPPRIYKNSLNYDNLQKFHGSSNPEPFSFLNSKVNLDPSKQLLTYITYTDNKVDDFVKKNIKLSSYIREEAKGVRYCPSLEAKILKFSSNVHHVWIEPEGFDSNLVYPSGVTTGFPFEYQKKIIGLIPGLETAKLACPGYSIEYDYIDPKQIYPTLETKKLNNLFLAGQINGTTGYEEAASQGIIAGINGSCNAQNKPKLIFSRTESYIGVMIDDLTSNGICEPYRMITSRSEFRLSLRQDNADKRLTKKGYNIGCVSNERYIKFLKTTNNMSLLKEKMELLKFPISKWIEILEIVDLEDKFLNTDKKIEKNLLELVRDYDLTNHEKCLKLISDQNQITDDLENIFNRVKIEAIYKPLELKEAKRIKSYQKEEQIEIPKDFNYNDKLLGLNKESIEILNKSKPLNIAGVSKLPNISQSTIFKLINYLKKKQKKFKS